MVLVVGWFSFEGMGATAGDLMARDVVCRWLQEAGVAFEVALAPPFEGGSHWEDVDPTRYQHVVFVCGPIHDFGEPFSSFLLKFRDCQIVGIDVSMVAPLEDWNPFDVLFERDSSRAGRPDLAIVADTQPVPVVGVLRSHGQHEYGTRRLHHAADDAIDRLLGQYEAALVTIDTRLDRNRSGLRSAAEVESLIAAMDVLVTTRLHGMVLGIKNDVPPLVIDPIAGGAKIRAQAKALGWPAVAVVDEVGDRRMKELFEWCLGPEAAPAVAASRARALESLNAMKGEFLAVVEGGDAT